MYVLLLEAMHAVPSPILKRLLHGNPERGESYQLQSVVV